MDKVRPSNLNSGFAGSDVGGRVIYFLPCLLACNLMVNPDLASEVLGWQKLHSALHPVQCCARSAACREEWRSCRHFCSPGAGCDGLSRLHRTAIRQHFKFHLKPRDLVCMKKMLVHLKRFDDRHQCLKMGQHIAAVVAGWSSRVGETHRRGGTRTTPRRGAHPRS